MTSSEDVLTSQEFRINVLEKIVKDRDEEIKLLKKRMDAINYFWTVHKESVRKVMARDEEAMKMAMDGEIVKPILRQVS